MVRIAIAMSGGVDSSVAAALLKKQGHELIGLHMKLAQDHKGEFRQKSCCSFDETMDARSVCYKLGIPFYVIDYQKEFREMVINYFVSEYSKGQTPNPCVMCNKKIKNGLAVLDGKNFIGRIVDTNYFSSRVLLVSDLNSKIPVMIEPSGQHAILSGRGNKLPMLEYLSDNRSIEDGNKIYTSGQEGIFLPGIPIGEVKKDKDKVNVLLFSDLKQITFVNINLGDN